MDYNSKASHILSDLIERTTKLHEDIIQVLSLLVEPALQEKGSSAMIQISNIEGILREINSQVRRNR